MTKYYVTPPTIEEGPAGGGRLFIRYRLNRGVSLICDNGVWSTIRFPSEDQTTAADLFYQGGRTQEISKATYDSLIAQGYSANVSAV